MKKILSVCGKILVGIMLLVGITTIVMYLFGFRFYSIKTGSMGSDYKVGTLLVVKKAEPSTLKVGDVISYTIDDKLTIVTHRIVEMDDKYVVTKGDAVLDGSAEVYYENIIGKEFMVIPMLGRFTDVWAGMAGRIVLIVIMVLAIISAGVSIYLYRKENACGREEEKTE